MEQNIADMLKDAFSEVEIDFDTLPFEEGSQTPPQLVMEEDTDLKEASNLWTTSDQASLAEHEQEENDDGTDSSEESPCIETERPQRMVHDTRKTASVQEVHQAGYESSEEDESTQNEDLDVPGLVAHGSVLGEVKHLSQEELTKLPLGSLEDQGTSSLEYQQIMEEEPPEQRSSGSDEDGPENYSRSEETSDGNADEPLIATETIASIGYSVGDDLREFTEDDQERIEESFAEYPSDMSQSETEESTEGSGDQTRDLGDNSGCTEKIRFSAVETNLEEESIDPTARYSDGEVTVLDAQATSEVDLEMVDEDGLQEYLENNSSAEENDRNWGDEREASNDQPNYDSDICSDHSTSQEETSNPSSTEFDGKCTGTDFIEDLGRADVDYISIDAEDTDGTSPEMDRDLTSTNPVSYTDLWSEEPSEDSTELFPTLKSVQLDPAEDECPLKVLDSMRDVNSFLPEVFWSSDVLTGQNNLHLDEYDWGLTAEELMLGGGEDQEGALEEMNSDEEGEEMTWDWEKEKTRIEAFNRFYGDQVEPEDTTCRNHKVTFQLERESSEYEEESGSSEEELGEDPDTAVSTVKSEFHSESDEEPQKKLFQPEKPKFRPKEQQPALMARPPRSKCPAVLKSVLALGLAATVGVVSFWWATDC